MGRTLELNYKISGSAADLERLLGALKATGAAAGGAGNELDKVPRKIKDVDNAASQSEKTIERLRKQLADLSRDGGKPAKEIRELQEQIRKLNQEGRGLEGLHETVRANLEHPFTSARIQISETLSALGKGGAIIAGVGAGLLLLGHEAFELVKEFGASARETQNFATRLGITADQAEKLAAAGKLVSVNVGTLEGSARLLAAALEDDSGKGAAAERALKRLGIATTDAAGDQKEMGEVLFEVLEHLSKIESASERVRISQQLLGRGAKEIQPLIIDYERLKKTVEELGVAFDEGDEKLLQANSRINELGVAWEEFKKKLAVAIAPIVIPVIYEITRTIAGKKTPGEKRFEATTNPQVGARETVSDLASTSRVEPLTSFLPSADDYLKGVTEAARNRAEQFKKNDNSIAALERRLEKLKTDGKDLETQLTKPIISEARFRETNEAFQKNTKDTEALEKQIKEAKERQALIERLPELLKQAQEKSVGELEKIEINRADLLRRLGKGYTDVVNKMFDTERANYLAKEFGKLPELVKKYAAEFKKAGEEIEREAKKIADANDKAFETDLRKKIEEGQKTVAALDEQLKIYADTEKKAAENQQKLSIARFAAQPQNAFAAERAQIEFTFRQRVAFANEEYGVQKKALEERLAGQNTIEEKLKLETELTRAKGELDKSLDDARTDREEKYIELQKKNLQEYRAAAGELFDAIFSRNAGSNLQTLFQNFAKGQAKIVFENIFQGAIANAAKNIGSTGLGNVPILKGTIFDPNKAGVELAQSQKDLRKSTDDLKTSVDTLTSSITGTQTGSGAVVPAAATGSSLESALKKFGEPGGFTGQGFGAVSAEALGGLGTVGAILKSLGVKGGSTQAIKVQTVDDQGNPVFTTTATAQKPQSIFSQLLTGAGSLFPKKNSDGSITGGLFAGLGIYGDDNKTSSASFATRLGNIAASAGAIAGAVAGVQSGIRQGGAGGGFKVASSVLGAAALIPGPQQPFVEGAALITGLIGSLFPNGREQRQRELTRELQNAKYDDPRPLNVAIDSSGRAIDTDFRGNLRVLNSAPTFHLSNVPVGFDPLHSANVTYSQQRTLDPSGGVTPSSPIIAGVKASGGAPIIVQVQTMDAKSFTDNAHHIADAMVAAIQNGHRVSDDIRKKVNPF